MTRIPGQQPLVRHAGHDGLKRGGSSHATNSGLYGSSTVGWRHTLGRYEKRTANESGERACGEDTGLAAGFRPGLTM
ncbi:hypothetical protein B0T26DRAFT_729616 [Lasiosphaeria miniovina]|uniref:Uncharacterized protein n=1 Tax=Lasiosphaeria miniovina TaxID=1954250 RepID=A0AA39ZT15_9PEZI|nr:uncharacterized protein B0T26DRAFT_729616 [Lasiosphaeria miniovina]KAK0703028.1 hypothetical protein B0T26DRAFT_729616 [Lasiosphaeria miniovina]